jgi:CheY-like chemotaxis protein
VRNGVEAVSGAGRVVVQLLATRITESVAGYETIEPGDYAVIRVSDSGIGIPKESMPRIFEPFFSSKRMGEQSGTGLGLAIVLGVIKEHEGFIDVRSRQGKGTEFSVYLPTVHDVPRSSIHNLVPCPRGMRILIVDDDLVQLRTGRRVLTSLGYSVETLGSGLRAYDVFGQAASEGQSPCDLVILDMMLNEQWDGLELYERIRELFPSQRAIIVSGHAPGERVQNALECGLTWLAKPYTVQSLTRAVADALNVSQG